MKKLLIAVIIALTTACSTVHHSWMDNAIVGVVDGQKPLVMLYDHTQDGIKYYRPQFASECPYNKAYAATDSNSITCFIRETRITQMDSYNHHVSSGNVLTPKKRNDSNHDFIEGVNPTNYIQDSL